MLEGEEFARHLQGEEGSGKGIQGAVCKGRPETSLGFRNYK